MDGEGSESTYVHNAMKRNVFYSAKQVLALIFIKINVFTTGIFIDNTTM